MLMKCNKSMISVFIIVYIVLVTLQKSIYMIVMQSISKVYQNHCRVDRNYCSLANQSIKKKMIHSKSDYQVNTKQASQWISKNIKLRYLCNYEKNEILEGYHLKGCLLIAIYITLSRERQNW